MRKKRTDFKYYSNKKYDGMMGRCYRVGNKSYANYGGRGIRVHGPWIKDIEVFRGWLIAELHRINASVEEFCTNSRKYTLDRIDVNGHYSPSNCRLVSQQENSRNRRCSNKQVIKSAEGEDIYV